MLSNLLNGVIRFSSSSVCWSSSRPSCCWSSAAGRWRSCRSTYSPISTGLRGLLAIALMAGCVYWAVPAVLSRCGWQPAADWWSGRPLWLHAALTILATPPVWLLILWADKLSQREHEGPLLVLLKSIAQWMIAFSLRMPMAVLGVAFVAVLASGVALLRLERDFLPPLTKGPCRSTSSCPRYVAGDVAARWPAKSRRVCNRSATLPRWSARPGEPNSTACGTVAQTELIATLNPQSGHNRAETLHEIREALADIPGIVTSVEQPLAHLISHMLSGVQAQCAIKLYEGDDLDILRRKAGHIKAAIAEVSGVTDLQVEPQVEIPQLQIEIDGHLLVQYGLTRGDINEFVRTAMQGEVVSEILLGQRTFDLFVRLDEPFRENIDAVRRLTLELPGGG